MKTIMLILGLLGSSVVEAKVCSLEIKTSKGAAVVSLETKWLRGVEDAYLEDRKQPATKCYWFFCSYPKVKGSRVYNKDLSSFVTFSTKEEIERQITACLNN